MARRFFVLAAVSGFLSVALGAFGAHALKSALSPDMLAVFETGIRYQVYHTIALFITGLALEKYPQKMLRLAGWFFLFGIILFSGSLYLLAVTEIKVLGAVTPLGGVAFLLGWFFLGLGFWNSRS